MPISIAWLRGARITLAGTIGASIVLMSPVAASASLGDSSAVAVDIGGTFHPADTGPMVVAATHGPVTSPPDAAYASPAETLELDLGPTLGGLQDVMWFYTLASSAASDGIGSSASASLGTFEMNTPSGALVIQGISSQVGCATSGASASFATPIVTLAGTPIALDPSGTTVIDLVNPPIPGFHMLVTLIQSTSQTATTASANGLTIVVDEDLTGLITANATVKLAQTSCSVSLAVTGGTVPPFALPIAIAFVALGAAILAVLRAPRRQRD